MKGLRWYTLVGQTPVPVDSFESFAMAPLDHRRVARTLVGNYLVSTVFLGFDPNWWMSNGNPLLFETMAFDENGASKWMRRCSTWLEAEEQHRRAVLEVNAEVPNVTPVEVNVDD